MCPLNITGSGWWVVWNADGQMEISKLASLLSAKSVGRRFSGSRLSHLHQVLAENYKHWSAVCESCRSACTWQVCEHWHSPLTLTCVRRWRTAGRKISCCLNKRDQPDAGVVLSRGRRGWLTHAWQCYTDDVVLLTASWNGVDKATEYWISSWCSAAL